MELIYQVMHSLCSREMLTPFTSTRRTTSRKPFIFFVAAFGFLTFRPHVLANEAAVALLRSKGLVQHRDVWISPEEQAIRSSIEELGRLERQLQDAQKQANGLVQHNEALRSQLVAAIENVSQLQIAIKVTQTGTPARNANEDALKKQQELTKELRLQYLEPERFSARPAVKAAVLQLNDARDTARLTVSRLRNLVDNLEPAYRKLSNDAALMSALSKLTPPGQLGPAATLSADLQRIDELEAYLNEPIVPIYRESGCYRLSAIINEQIPATFTFRESSEPTIIPMSLAQAAGAEYGKEESFGFHQTKDGRKFALKRATIKALRLGSIVLEQVPVSVLPPEGEDQAAQLGGVTLEGLRPKLQPHLLRLQLRPKAAGAEQDK